MTSGGFVSVHVEQAHAAPFGRVKESGLDRKGGHHGILDYLEPKYIAAAW